MQIGYINQPERGANDLVLLEIVRRLASAGVRLAGTVQLNVERADRSHCDMDVQVLPDGPRFRISQDLGSLAKGCRLDPGSLERAVFAVMAGLDQAEVLIVNKFGKLESEGRGFCSAIAEALSRNMPVLVAVNSLNLPGFHDFAGDLAEPLSADPQTIADRIVAALGRQFVQDRTACD